MCVCVFVFMCVIICSQLVQTQLFVSHLDRLRIVYEKDTWQR